LLNTNIICRFGRFGSTSGALIANNQVACPSPSTRIAPEYLAEENVEIELALNGQDFIKVSIPFRFVGTKPAGNNNNERTKWVLTVLMGGIVLVFILYVILRSFVPRLAKEKFPLIGKFQMNDDSNINKAPQRKNIVLIIELI